MVLRLKRLTSPPTPVQFLMLASFVIIAFASAFFILLQKAPTATADGLAAPTSLAAPLTDGIDPLSHVSTADGLASAAAARQLRHAGAPSDPTQTSYYPTVVPPLGAASAGDEGGTEAALSFLSVLKLLMEGTMDGEPDRLMGLQIEAEVTTFSWLMMALFGITVVLLLLNLLIARFAKTFDMIYENVDANFKVAFARVVLKGAGQELVPPPFNLIRLVVLTIYAIVGVAVAAAAACWRFCCGVGTAGAGRGAASRQSHATPPSRPLVPSRPLMRKSSSLAYAPIDEDEADASALLEDCSLTIFESRKIKQFLRKATSPEVPHARMLVRVRLRVRVRMRGWSRTARPSHSTPSTIAPLHADPVVCGPFHTIAPLHADPVVCGPFHVHRCGSTLKSWRRGWRRTSSTSRERSAGARPSQRRSTPSIVPSGGSPASRALTTRALCWAPHMQRIGPLPRQIFDPCAKSRVDRA